MNTMNAYTTTRNSAGTTVTLAATGAVVVSTPSRCAFLVVSRAGNWLPTTGHPDALGTITLDDGRRLEFVPFPGQRGYVLHGSTTADRARKIVSQIRRRNTEYGNGLTSVVEFSEVIEVAATTA